MKKIVIVWGNWGPYHYARFRALHEEGRRQGLEVEGIELFPSSGCYDWETSTDHPAVHHLKMGDKEVEFRPGLLIRGLLPLLFKLRPDVILVPSYWHWSLFINYTGRLAGARIVMMNESHAATEKARGFKRSIKKMIVRGFHAGFVGGTPHRRHFASLGLDESKIFLGYDTVDNDYFTRHSSQAREAAARLREEFELPDRYFLNLGRMVTKKNLPLLIRSYAMVMARRPDLQHDLVLVGSGEEEENLKALAKDLGLAVKDHTAVGRKAAALAAPGPELAPMGMNTGSAGSHTSIPHEPAVHFYGFRQIEENPVFYALASAFILPSTTEEWGLVINEAMACSLPVLASDQLGCAEDLVTHGVNGFTFNPASADELADSLEKVAAPGVAEQLGQQSLAIIRNWGCDRFAAGAIAAARAATGDIPANRT
jgi:1,2-diacylglycerol 3-alpha-glucosyltransferase